MTFTDYLIDISLIALVLFQIRGRRLTTRALLLPLAIVGYVAYSYLRGVPTAGNDLFLVAGCAALGATLGGLSNTEIAGRLFVAEATVKTRVNRIFAAVYAHHQGPHAVVGARQAPVGGRERVDPQPGASARGPGEPIRRPWSCRWHIGGAPARLAT
jgi:hypothetical protein